MQERQPALGTRLLWGAALAIGFGIVWGFVGGWVGSTAVQRRSFHETIFIRVDGTALVLRTEHRSWSVRTYRDLEGRPVSVPEDEKQARAASVPGRRSDGDVPEKLNWGDRLKLSFEKREREPIVWYFVHDGERDGRGYFQGFDAESNFPIGFIGRDGFSRAPIPHASQIPVDNRLMATGGNWSGERQKIEGGIMEITNEFVPGQVHVPSGQEVLLVDFHSRTVRSVFKTPAPIYGISLLNRYDDVHSEPSLLVRTANHVDVLGPKYEVRRRFEVPPGNFSVLTYHEADDGTTILVDRSWINANLIGGAVEEPATLRWLTSDGRVEKLESVTLKEPRQNGRLNSLVTAISIPAIVPSLLLESTNIFADHVARVEKFPGASYADSLVAFLHSHWPGILMELLVAALLPIWTLRHMARFALPRRDRIVGTLVVILFGVPGVAGYLLHRRWPVRAECPACHARSPRDRVPCAHCGTPFPEPQLRGIEVFA